MATMNDTSVWAVWENEEGSEGETSLFREGHVPVDVDGNIMKLLHKFEVKGSICSVEQFVNSGEGLSDAEVDQVSATVRRAFDYSKHWNYGEGDLPSGCRPLDENKSDRA